MQARTFTRTIYAAVAVAVLASCQTLQAAAKKGQLNRKPAELTRVRGIAQRLIAQTAAFRPDAPG